MSLLCYNKGCGQRFEADNNPEGKLANVSLALTWNYVKQHAQFGDKSIYSSVLLQLANTLNNIKRDA